MTAPAPASASNRSKAPQAIWSRPDPALTDAGIEGEYLVARVRLVAMALLLIAPTWNLIHYGDQSIHVAGFAVTLIAALTSVGIFVMLRRGGWRPWVGFASSAFDVSMVSLALVSFHVVASPLVALNSSVTFEMYFLAIVATSLRYDARICIVVGLLAIAEYGGLWAYASATHDLGDPGFVAEAGSYLPLDLATRLILLAIATLLAVTIVRRAQRLLYLSARDRLTGLYNRGHLDRAMTSAMDQVRRDKQPLAVAILDVDHFKVINDVHGHALGDRVLQQVADILSRSMRKTDTVARFGGEAFVILMPNSTREAALARIESLRREVRETSLALNDGKTLKIGFSAGVSGVPTDAEATQPQSLMAVADRRLLAAKRAGRGRCFGAD